MILFLLALAQVAGPPVPTTGTAPSVSGQQALANCIGMARTDAEKAVRLGGEWRDLGGGISAAHCLGNALSTLGRWSEAAVVFEAGVAEAPPTSRSAELWVLAGSAWLAAGDGARALKAVDAALAVPTIPDQLRADTLFDRAQANVMRNDLPAARLDIDQGLGLAPTSAFGWYLSAALADRQQQAGKAQSDIARALELAPGDAATLLLAGTIAGKAGDTETARSHYARAAQADPNSEAGKSAQAALAAEAASEPAAPAPAPAPAPQSR